MANDKRNPGIRCARRRPPCGHMRSEHGNGRCFGVSYIQGVARDCDCKGHMEPPDPERFVRVGETVED